MELGGPKSMRWTMVVVLLGLILMATGPGIAEGVFGIAMNPCSVPKCSSACKNILHEKFMSASCYNGTLCMCFGGAS